MINPEEAIRDFMGREIKAGDTIIYPVRKGYTVLMKEMRATSITAEQISGFNPEGRKVTVKNVQNVAVVLPRQKDI